jgi:hypothetical protein
MDTRSGVRADVAVAGAPSVEAATSAVSWAAIIAGAFVAASASLILLSLGSGLGLAAVSPWSNAGISATAFSVGTGIWIILVQWIASGTGGYLTGRLRTRWTSLHTHEVFFRDTAHGFLTWAVATVISAGLVAAVTTGAVRTGIQGGAAIIGAGAGGAAAAQAAMADSRGYQVDSLFRPTDAGAAASAPAGGDASAGVAGGTTARSGTATPDPRPEAARILAQGVANGDVSAEDRAYLARMVAARTGLSDADARKRVDDVIGQVKAAETKAKAAADAARKAASAVSIFTALAMVIGAFIACAAAALGGKERDQHA